MWQEAACAWGHPVCAGPICLWGGAQCVVFWTTARVRDSDASRGWLWRWPRALVEESRQQAWALRDTELLHRCLPSVALLTALPRLPGAA